MLKRLLWALVTCCACIGFAHAQQIRLSISTGGTGGVWYPMGGAMANVLSQVDAEHLRDRGSHRRQRRQHQAGRHRPSDIGFSMVDTAYEGMTGAGKFKEKVPMRTLAVVHPLVMHVVTARRPRHRQDERTSRASASRPGRREAAPK